MPEHTDLPEVIETEDVLDELLSRPSPAVTKAVGRLGGDILILGVSGKMGLTLARMAARAVEAAGTGGRVIGAARFSDPAARETLEACGVETVRCDLLDREAVDALPSAANVIYMAGRKFGTAGREALTWAVNVAAPVHVAETFRESRIVAFSTGCVYPPVSPAAGGCAETTPVDPVGDYAQSCVGRERIFAWGSGRWGTPVCLFRLNYAIDLRYGVLHDIAARVRAGEPVDLGATHVNVIWQGDANRQALLCLEHAADPPFVLNVTGPETLSTRRIAERFGELLGRAPVFGPEGERMYLSDASKATALFGYPSVPPETMIRWTAAWTASGGRSLEKPTHFETSNGQY